MLDKYIIKLNDIINFKSYDLSIKEVIKIQNKKAKKLTEDIFKYINLNNIDTYELNELKKIIIISQLYLYNRNEDIRKKTIKNNSNFIRNIDRKLNISKFLIISDTHFLFKNKEESLKYIDVLNSIIVKEDINVIFHGGDFIDGIYKSNLKKDYLNPALEELKDALNIYKLENNCKTYLTLGNHDVTTIVPNKIDDKITLENGYYLNKDLIEELYRNDNNIIVDGLGFSTYYINDKKMIISHKLHRNISYKLFPNEYDFNKEIIYKNDLYNAFNFIGHSHIYDETEKGIKIPPLCNDIKPIKDFCFNEIAKSGLLLIEDDSEGLLVKPIIFDNYKEIDFELSNINTNLYEKIDSKTLLYKKSSY